MVAALISVLVAIEPTGWDLSVYREGALTLLREPEALYGPFVGPPNAPGLPFTYPTFAAILFLPMAFFPYWVSVALTMAASIILTYFVAKDLSARVTQKWPKLSPFITPLTLTSLMLMAAPFRDTVWFGQINILILGACYLTFVRYKSLMPFVIAVGICAGIKLTPIALLILPFAMRKWRAVLVGVATVIGTQLVGLLFQTQNTLDYWLDVVQDPSRVGNVGYIDNVSLQGVLERLNAPSLVWLVLALGVGLSFVALLWKLHEKVDRVVLLGVASACPLLVSPVSWSHHWVWLPVMTFAWAVLALRLTPVLRRTMLVSLALCYLVLSIGVKKIVAFSGYFPDGELPVWCYVLPAIPVLVQLLCLAISLASARQASHAEPASQLS
ncbi:glycosyltransferase 87 family protein [Glutamicibacter arilaitensis]|uniref:glycosyltransferase 87 family protein n=1 Tax=Glutamicibacter arilaitensis TaxID=256701 RepID=UPI00384F27AB